MTITCLTTAMFITQFKFSIFLFFFHILFIGQHGYLSLDADYIL